MVLIVFIICFLGLFFLSRVLTATLSEVFLHMTKNHGIAIQLLALLFLPGVIIHELAHWLVASILFVPTGEIEFFPQVHGNKVKLGSVQVAKTDPFRRFFIGIAPVLCGLGVIFGVYWFLQPTLFPLTIKSAIFFYTVFEIGNTMFSSKKDLEGVAGFFIFLVLGVLLLIFLHVPIGNLALSFALEPHVQEVLSQINIFLFVALGLNSGVIGVLRIGTWFFQSFIASN